MQSSNVTYVVRTAGTFETQVLIRLQIVTLKETALYQFLQFINCVYELC